MGQMKIYRESKIQMTIQRAHKNMGLSRIRWAGLFKRGQVAADEELYSGHVQGIYRPGMKPKKLNSEQITNRLLTSSFNFFFKCKDAFPKSKIYALTIDTMKLLNNHSSDDLYHYTRVPNRINSFTVCCHIHDRTFTYVI